MNSCMVDADRRACPFRPARRVVWSARRRRGQSLVEFAVVALVVYMLLAAILTFGHMLFVAQGLQSAADLGAREISRTPLPATSTLEEALNDDGVREEIFDEAWLVVDLEDFYANFTPPDGEQASVFRHVVPRMPLLNQQLAPMMIVDRTSDAWLLRYPGALLDRDTPISPPADVTYPSWVATSRQVRIPIVTRSREEGEEVVDWASVVEEIQADGNPNPFQLSSAVGSGVVALRINYPFQSASMSAFQARPPLGEPGDSDMGSPVLVEGDDGIMQGTYAGENGLGVQQAFGERVRPFRRVISAQAIYRREVFRSQ